MGYPWPASRLTRADMIQLCKMRNQARRPLTKLLHEAVSAYYELLMKPAVAENGESSQSLCCVAPRLEWRGTAENALIRCVSCGFALSLSDDGQLGGWHGRQQRAWQGVEKKLEEIEKSGASTE